MEKAHHSNINQPNPAQPVSHSYTWKTYEWNQIEKNGGMEKPHGSVIIMFHHYTTVAAKAAATASTCKIERENEENDEKQNTNSWWLHCKSHLPQL